MFVRTSFLAIAVASALTLSACGSDSSGGDGLARADLAKKADVICATAKTASTNVKPPTDFATNPDAAAEYLGKIEDLTKKEATDFAALEPDAEAKADWNAFVKSENDLVDLLDKVVTKAKAKDKTGLTEFTSDGQKLSTVFVDAANKIGAKGCAQG